MTSRIGLLLLLGALSLQGLAAAPAAPAADNSGRPTEHSFRERFAEGRSALDAARFEDAASHFAQACEMRPESAEALYNLGLARYRLASFDPAREAFRDAAARGDAALAAAAIFNLGNVAYADALTRLPRAPEEQTAIAPPPAPPDEASPAAPDVAGAIERLETALKHYKDAATALPNDAAPRAGAERTTRLLKMLREQQEEQQQQQGDQKQEQQQDQQKSEEEQKQEQKQEGDEQQEQQDPQQGQKEQPQDQQQQQQQRGEGEKPQPKPSDKSTQEPEPKPGEEKQKQPSKPQPKDQQQEPQQSPGEASPATGAQGQAQPKQISKDELERLLQGVRDRERARRLVLEAQKQQRPKPAAKDW